jgi:hypothetical protein
MAPCSVQNCRGVRTPALGSFCFRGHPGRAVRPVNRHPVIMALPVAWKRLCCRGVWGAAIRSMPTVCVHLTRKPTSRLRVWFWCRLQLDRLAATIMHPRWLLKSDVTSLRRLLATLHRVQMHRGASEKLPLRRCFDGNRRAAFLGHRSRRG